MSYYSGEGETEISETAPILVKIEKHEQCCIMRRQKQLGPPLEHAEVVILIISPCIQYMKSGHNKTQKDWKGWQWTTKTTKWCLSESAIRHDSAIFVITG